MNEASKTGLSALQTFLASADGSKSRRQQHPRSLAHAAGCVSVLGCLIAARTEKQCKGGWYCTVLYQGLRIVKQWDSSHAWQAYVLVDYLCESHPWCLRFALRVSCRFILYFWAKSSYSRLPEQGRDYVAGTICFALKMLACNTSLNESAVQLSSSLVQLWYIQLRVLISGILRALFDIASTLLTLGAGIGMLID